LAEQLTVNQGAPLPNAEENGTSQESAALQLAVSAETGADRSGPPSNSTGQLTARAVGGDAELAEVLDGWATLPEAIRSAILTLVRATS